jgi:hypothetical protein
MTDIYEIHLRKYLDSRWSNRFEEFTISYKGDGTTLLTGPVLDQVALHGLLIKVRDLGLTLLGLVRVRSEQKRVNQKTRVIR